MNQLQTITISAVLNGYVVKVGCQELVFESRKRLLKELNRYLKKPDKVEREYTGGESGTYGVIYSTDGIRFGEGISAASVHNPQSVTYNSGDTGGID